MPTGTGGIHGLGYTGAVLERALDALGLRQRVAAHNVANVNTPGYKPYHVSFEAALSQALADDHLAGARSGGRAKHFDVHVQETAGVRMREDGNAVDIDREMATVAKTAIVYDAVAQQWSGLYGRLRLAVREGRR